MYHLIHISEKLLEGDCAIIIQYVGAPDYSGRKRCLQSTESDQNHAEIGAEIARKMGEDPRVINAIAAHHNDIEPTSTEAVYVQIADAISAARPGARRETINNYYPGVAGPAASRHADPAPAEWAGAVG